MTKQLFTIIVNRDEAGTPLRFNYSSRNKMHKAAFALRRAGYKVSGEYDFPTTLNQSPEHAVATAKAFHG